jgi:large repetitive protein
MIPLWLILSLACTPEVPGVADSEGCAWFEDGDGDGYGAGDGVYGACDTGASGLVSEAGDCNDSDPTINPGATEYCNGEDDDCDRAIDEDDAENAAWYVDVDQDGYGTPLTAPVYSCEQPQGYSKFDGDCDDYDTEVNPGADEVCNGIDDDCDDLTDDADDPVLGTGTFYRDGDADGYGRPDVIAEACKPPSDYVSTSGDCNDANSTINPGAHELCDDLDQDCDERVDEDATDTVTWGYDGDSDGHGDEGTETDSCDPPGDDWVADATDCDDRRSDVYPGASEHCEGADEDCDGATDEEPVDGATYYLDSDTDGYGDPAVSLTACEEPAAYVTNASDCYDGNKNANPDQTEFYTGDRGDTSFDYDCDGTEEQELTDLGECEANDEDGDAECNVASEGWNGSAPACGDQNTWVTSCVEGINSSGDLTCAESGARGTQACR